MSRRGAALRWAALLGCAGLLLEPHVVRSAGGAPQRGDVAGHVLALSFEGYGLGPIGEPGLRDMWQDVESVILSDRIQIAEEADGERVLRVVYPRGGVGPRESGGAFILKIAPGQEYYLSYRVRLVEGFDFRKGGKLPGLSSGGGRYTGGRIPRDGDGWSARLVWGRAGSLGVYLYSVDTPGPWGTTMTLGSSISPGTWHTIVQRVRLNTDDLPNGILQVWLDGALRLDRRDVRFRSGQKGKIDSLCFSTFYGGHTPDFAPAVETRAFFDDFVVSVHAPDVRR